MKINPVLLPLLLLGFFHPAFAQPTCEDMLVVRDLNSFGRAMSQGMLLHSNQTDLFEVYRKVFFGDPGTAINGSTLQSVTDVLKKHPELTKPHFREYQINRVQKVYDVPESLSKHLTSQNTVSGQIRSSLFQVDANLGYWKKMLGYEDIPPPENLTKEQKKSRQEQSKTRFSRYLDQIISKENRDLLKDDKTDYTLKIKTLFRVLQRVFYHLERRGRNSNLLRLAMADLVATTGFHNQATQALLKSKNGLDKIEGLRKILDERDSIAMELGFEGHFTGLLNSLTIKASTLSNPALSEAEVLAGLERDVLAGAFHTLPSETIRVRSLSIQEAPFRSCLGGSDCSSRTYFTKALDPNFNYFTMTDSENHSSGHVTVVLGTAKDQNGNTIKTAFVDKLQNVSNQMIPIFLEAVRQSLAEREYVMALPKDVGDHNGLSNMDMTRHFVAQEILPKLHESYVDFTPHSNSYQFQNKYSRAYDRLHVTPYQFTAPQMDLEIHPGQAYPPRLADPGLDKRKLVQDLLDLKDSKNESDVLKYIASGSIVASLEKIGLYSQKEFLTDLKKISSDSKQAFQIRKQAFFETLLSEGLGFEEVEFSEMEKTQMTSEIKQWAKSSDKRRRSFVDGATDRWFQTALTGNSDLARKLIWSRLVDINQKNKHGFTALTIAVQNRQSDVIKCLLSNPNITPLELDAKGFTAIDHAIALGSDDLVTLIRQERPDLHIKDQANRVHQAMEFIEVKPGSFEMGDQRLPVTITKPFEMMSTLVTQKMVAQLFQENPFKFSVGENRVLLRSNGKALNVQPDHPAEMLSWNESKKLLDLINTLSEKGDPLLSKLIPGHQKGDHYDLPTEAQDAFVRAKAKTEDGDTIDAIIQRGDLEKLKQYAWFRDNSGGTTQPVAQKKPLFVDGQPIYDLHGLTSVWVKDRYDATLSGGTDPEGPRGGSGRVFRGGGWYHDAQVLLSANRYGEAPGSRYFFLGLRLVRTR